MKARQAIQKLTAYPVSPFSRKGKIRLDLNESTRGCSPAVLKAISNISPEELNAYPDYGELLTQLSAYYQINEDQILLTNGADDGIRAVMQTFVEANDTVVLAHPTFGMIPIHARVVGASLHEVPYSMDLQFPVDGYLKALASAPTLVTIVRPDSPTGALISRESFCQIMEKAGNAIVLLDETYHHFCGESFVDLLSVYPNLLILQSFSKAWGLAGLRLGVVMGNPALITEIRKVNPPFSANTLAVKAARATLNDTSFLQQVVEDVAVQKQYLLKKMVQLNLKAVDTSANFILVKVGDSAREVQEQLLERKILVKSLDSIPLLRGYLRVAIGTREELDIFLQALQEILPPEALLFDMDGVLVDVSCSYREAIRKTASYFLGREVSVEEVENYKRKVGYNNDWDATETIIRENGGIASREDIIDHFQRLYLGNSWDGLIREEKWLADNSLLKGLAQRFKLGIVTGRPREEALFVLRLNKVLELFETVICMEDVPGRGKPHPDGI
ncbi:MAG: histidinol-phosphate transaminase, partial [Calditrichaeota bacterium]